MNADTVMDIRPFHDLRFQSRPVLHFDPKVRSLRVRPFDPLRIPQQQGILAVVTVKACQRQIAVLRLCLHSARMEKCQRITDGRLAGSTAERPRSAMLQQFAVVVERMADGPVCEESPALVHTGCFHHQRRDRTVDIRLAYYREALFIQQGVSRTRHNADLTLQRIPALDRSRRTSVPIRQIPDRHLQGGHIQQLLLFNGNIEMLFTVSHYLSRLRTLFLHLLHFCRQFRHGNRRQLDIEFLQQLALVTHGRPEVKRSRADLQDTDASECLYHIAYCQETVNTLCKLRILQITVCQIGKGHPESPQYLTGRKNTALAVAQTDSLFIRTFVPGTPQQHRKIQVLRQSCHLVFRAEITVREEKAVHFFLLEFLFDPDPVALVMQQAVLRNIVDIYEINPHFSKLLSRVISIFYCRRCTEDTPSGRSKPKSDLCHIVLHSEAFCIRLLHQPLPFLFLIK